MDINYALLLLDEMREEWYPTPQPGMFYKRKRSEFEQYCYARAAINEIQHYIFEHDGDIITIIEEFIHDVDVYSCCCTSVTIHEMFSVYKDVGRDVFDMFRAML